MLNAYSRVDKGRLFALDRRSDDKTAFGSHISDTFQLFKNLQKSLNDDNADRVDKNDISNSNITNQFTNTREKKELLRSDKSNNKHSMNTLKYQSTYDVCVYSATYTCQEAKEGSAVAVTVRIQLENTSL